MKTKTITFTTIAAAVVSLASSAWAEPRTDENIVAEAFMLPPRPARVRISPVRVLPSAGAPEKAEVAWEASPATPSAPAAADGRVAVPAAARLVDGPSFHRRPASTIATDTVDPLAALSPEDLGAGVLGSPETASGKPRLATRPASIPRPPEAVAAAPRGLDEDEVRGIARALMSDVLHCDARATAAGERPIAGDVSLSFVVRTSGRVARVAVAAGPGHHRFERCVAAAVKRWPFPRAGADTPVEMPLVIRGR